MRPFEMLALTIRNLTPDTIVLVRVEHFQDPDTFQSRPSGHFFDSRTNVIDTITSGEVENHASKFQHRNLDVQLRTLEAYTYNADSSENAESSQLATTKLCITVEDNQKCQFRVDMNPSYTQKSLQIFTALSSNTSPTLEALFHPATPVSHLAIHTNSAHVAKSWMKSLPDTLPISAISIPGTHNSHTHYRALPSVRCQAVDIKTQLSHGIRFLDIRLQPANDTDPSKKDLYLVHGAFPISLTGRCYFAPILQTCYDFLAANPSETLLISPKREGIGNATDAHLASILQQHYITPHASKWYTGTSVPRLGDVRGKIVLIRRFHTTTTATKSSATSSSSPSSSHSTMQMGLDATPWPHNATHALFPSTPKTPVFCIQDFCDVLEPALIPTKVQHVNEHLVRAGACVHPIGSDSDGYRVPHPLYLNFLSASNFWKRSVWPERIAKVVSRETEEWLCREHGLREGDADEKGIRKRGAGDAGTGIVIMDFVGEGGDWDLVKLVIGMNMGILRRSREVHRNA